MRPFVLASLALAVLACGGPSVQSATPEVGPTLAIEQFMAAVADSNLNEMANLWGTSSGSASKTGQPSDYRRRIQIMHAFLKGGSAKVLGVREDQGNKVVMIVELTRPDCRQQVPFTTVRAGEVWLVTAVDLAQVGAPGTNCSGVVPPPPG